MRKNFQIDNYLSQVELKYHQELLIDKVKKVKPKSKHILDLGCANCILEVALLDIFPNAEITGVEISSDLVEKARVLFQGNTNIEIIQSSIEEFVPQKKYDVIIASGVLSLFDDPFPMLKEWIQWLENDGVLVIFGRFNTYPVDTKVHYRNHYNDNGWESGLTSYSIHSLSGFLENQPVRFSFTPFELPFDREPSDNPTNTWTVKTENGKRLIINGANLIAEFHYLVVRKEVS